MHLYPLGGIQMRMLDPRYEIMTYLNEKDIYAKIACCGRVCYKSDQTGNDSNFVYMLREHNHLSVLEHVSISVKFTIDRGVSHELVRHRLASYSQRSQRYVKENEPRYIEPPVIQDNKLAHEQFEEAMKACWQTYGELLVNGIKPEIARYVLPNACETQIICTWNFREIRHIIKLRTSKRALPEFRAVAEEVRRIAKEIAPQVFGDL